MKTRPTRLSGNLEHDMNYILNNFKVRDSFLVFAKEKVVNSDNISKLTVSNNTSSDIAIIVLERNKNAKV